MKISIIFLSDSRFQEKIRFEICPPLMVDMVFGYRKAIFLFRLWKLQFCILYCISPGKISLLVMILISPVNLD